MKNLTKVLVLFIFICCSTNLSAQISIGPKVGLNIANWSGNFPDDYYYYDEVDKKSITGFQFGISFDIPINNLISIQPEILYLQKGTVLELSADYGSYSYSNKFEVNMNFVEIPILAKVKFGPEEGIKFFANAGPSFGYALNGKIIQEYDYGSYSEKGEEDIDWDDDFFNRTDISLAFGAGVNYPVGPVNLFIEARYLLGLNKVLKEDEDYEGENPSFKNTGIGISFGALFVL